MILLVGWGATALLAYFVDPRARGLPHAFFIAWVGVRFWLDQDKGLITRDGDPHLFWFAIVLFCVAEILMLWIVASEMGLTP